MCGPTSAVDVDQDARDESARFAGAALARVGATIDLAIGAVITTRFEALAFGR